MGRLCTFVVSGSSICSFFQEALCNLPRSICRSFVEGRPTEAIADCCVRAMLKQHLRQFSSGTESRVVERSSAKGVLDVGFHTFAD